MPEINERLFDAAERVLAREGPNGLTSRAVTEEAGCAKGILHNHFADFDNFLVEFVLDRIRQMVTRLASLRAAAGGGNIVDNLTDAVTVLFGSSAPAIASLVMSRPSLFDRVRAAAAAAPGSPFAEVEETLAGYLDDEKRLGRIAEDADSKTLAFTIFGSLHQLFFTQGPDALDRARVRHVIEALVGGLLLTDAAPG
jgi:AcrR family transcriptional regulator